MSVPPNFILPPRRRGGTRRGFHRSDAEFAEFGMYLNQKTLCSASAAPPRLGIRKFAHGAQLIADGNYKSYIEEFRIRKVSLKERKGRKIR